MSLPNSDGWNWKKPRSIHRVEPRASAPRAITTSNPRISSA
jgi:hypothetical protein